MNSSSRIRIPASRVFLKDNDEIDQVLICSICSELVCLPEECGVCQNIFCGECIKSWISRKDKCPFDCPPPFQSTKPHKIVRQKIADLRFKCTNWDLGCNEPLALEDLESHGLSCEHKEVKCPVSPLCVERGITMKNINIHALNCGFARTTCSSCDFQIFRKDLADHDCVEFLKKKINKLRKSQLDFEKFNDDRMNKLIKRIEELELGVEKVPVCKYNEGLVCKLGHELTWNAGGTTSLCPICYEENANSRLICLHCIECICLQCIKPLIIGKNCPENHPLVKEKNFVGHLCDFCCKDLSDKFLWRDKDCDFDLCEECFGRFQI